ncbi:MAG: tyrosine recombinase [Chloroflexi bacterium]|nr:tyrosine recombinase [Chloroflexota bacterium]
MEEKINAFLENLQTVKNYSRNTLAAYHNDLNQFLNFATSEQAYLVNWVRVDKSLLLSFILHLKEREYTPASVSRKVAVLKSFFHFLVARGDVNADPTATLDSPRFQKALPHVLSEIQVTQLLAAPQGDAIKQLRDRAMLELLYATGLRVTELLSIDLPDVNVDTQTVHRPGRGGKRRVIPINDRANDALIAYIENARAKFKPREDEPAVFLNLKGARLTRQGVWLILRDYCARAGIEAKVTPHTLRHSFAAHAITRGEGLENIQRVMGHSSIATTQIYTRLAPELPEKNKTE